MSSRVDFNLVAAFLILALAVGGAGIAYPQLQMALHLGSLAVAGWFIATRRQWRFEPLTRIALGLFAAILLLPLLQLIPLPPSVWTQLPGRSVALAADTALGSVGWRPLTLDQEGTIRAALALLPASAMCLACLFLPTADRSRLLWLAVGFALFSATLGIAQAASGGLLTPYVSGHLGSALGMFVNRNHQAAFLLLAMPIATGFAARRIARGAGLAFPVATSLGVLILLAIAVIATTSRMGLILLPVVIAASVAMLFFRRRIGVAMLSSVAALTAVLSLLLASGRVDRVLDRFAGFHDARFAFWTDVQWALNEYGLVGTGFGTFVPVFQSAESLESLGPDIVNHAHNDYLELFLEGGVPAMLLLAGVIVLLGYAALRALRPIPSSDLSPADPFAVGAALLGIAILLAASLVDYPMRMPSLSVMFALFAAILLPRARLVRNGAEGSGLPARRSARQAAHAAPRVRPGRALVAAVIAAPIAFVAVQAGMAAHQLANRDPARAVRWAPWSTKAQSDLATSALIRGDLDVALAHARTAVALSPISAPAIRSAGLVHLAQARTVVGNRLMGLAVVLGWRDPLTQLWAIRAAQLSGEPDKAIQRAEAMFRQKVGLPAAVQILAAGKDQPALALLADRLGRTPDWRRHFFRASRDLPLAVTDGWIRLVALMEDTPAPATLDESRHLVDRLTGAGQDRQAQRLWLLLQDGDSLLPNGDFETVDDRKGMLLPHHWHVPRMNRSLVRIEHDRASGNRSLHVRRSENRIVLSQELMLAPGPYKLEYRAKTSGTPARLTWELRCLQSRVRQTAENRVDPEGNWVRFEGNFTVPVRDCVIQRLTLLQSPDDPVRDVWLDDLRLQEAIR